MTKNPEAKISIEQLKTALESLDWANVKAILETAGSIGADPGDVAQALRRASGLILKYPVAAEKKRDALLVTLSDHMSGISPGRELHPAVRDAISTLRTAEAGYRKLVGELSKTDAAKLEPVIHISAAIRRAEGELDDLQSQWREQLAERHNLSVTMTVTNESGDRIDVDGALEHCIDFVSMTLQMEAFKGKWFDVDGNIVVPSLPEVSEQQVHQAGTTLFLAVIWQRWQMTEEKARVMGRTLRILDDEERPKGAPEELKSFIVDEGDATADWLQRVAFERVTDKLSQNLLETQASVGINRQQQSPTGALGVQGILSRAWVSDEEVHGVWGLTQFLAYDVLADQELHGGLRLVEWVRGYAALMLLARGARTGGVCRTKSGWLHYFAGFGMYAAMAETLIERLTFKRSSRDLFDHPFIKLADGRYRLFAPAMRATSIPMVVLSALSHLGVQLGAKKGSGFEAMVREIFEDAGLETYAFKEKRGNEEYEYDVVVPWGDYLFVIECKNRSLPFGSPVQMHYFDLGIRDNIRQIQRLMRGLADHPDILAKHLPAEAASRTKVPVVLNCFPYAVPGPIEGVYLYDYSALSRFFLSGEIMLKAAGPDKESQEFGTGKRLWAGNQPTPDDLLIQLARPQQLESMMALLKRDRKGFPLPPDGWVFGTEFTRDDSKELTQLWEEAVKAVMPK